MTGTKRLAPRRAAGEMIRQLRERADPARAAASQRYFKEPVERYGLDTPACRGMTRDLLGRVETR